MEYNYVLHSTAFKIFITLSAKERRVVVDAFQQLEQNPFSEGKSVEIGEIDRLLNASHFGKFIILWWPDHAVKELHIVNL
jgi:mRNA-degrading endonuclease RelE of RelBE toxin-antitoxin system